jgi:sugar phosphate isomerase/epimerase
MQIKILSPLWGHEHIALEAFLQKVKTAGYDGLETWLPDDPGDKRFLFDYLEEQEMYLVTHQHQASGSTFDKFRADYLRNLHLCAEPRPLVINSHTGRDYFTLEQHLALVDTAAEFSEKTGVMVLHETHRGRLGYSPQMTETIFDLRKDFRITADLSHWVCVTESMLEHFAGIVDEAIDRSLHIHARIGFEEGPQVPDPRDPEWKYALDHFFGWWDRIVAVNKASGRAILPITTEFGPPPYMPVLPFSGKPLSDQFEINCHMMNLLRERYVGVR